MASRSASSVSCTNGDPYQLKMLGPFSFVLARCEIPFLKKIRKLVLGIASLPTMRTPFTRTLGPSRISKITSGSAADSSRFTMLTSTK